MACVYRCFPGRFRQQCDHGAKTPGRTCSNAYCKSISACHGPLLYSQARSRARQVQAEAEMRRRRLPSFGNRSLEELEAELTDVQRRIRDEGLRSKAASEFSAAQAVFDDLAERVRNARRAAGAMVEEAAETKSLELRTERNLLTLREDRAAASFLRRLSPVCCPRCDQPIAEGRREMESSQRRCSVCTEELPAAGDRDIDGDIAEAEERFGEVKRLRADASRVAERTAEAFGPLTLAAT